MIGKYFKKKGKRDSAMKEMKNQIDELEEKLAKLGETVFSLQKKLVQTQALLKYLSTTQLELSGDMSNIYKSLKNVVAAIQQPVNQLKFPVLGADDDDDDLLN
jgi:DNA-binding ferritin-like protein